MTKISKENLQIGIILVFLTAILAFGVSNDNRLDAIEQDVAVIKDRLSIERKTVMGLQ
tara:strand:+ start:1152 stop:1325 length:174 start_codon:yes stop_codon:yes gene_type:complete